jgi:hypothetical protein
MYWVEKIHGRMSMLLMVSQCQCPARPARAGHACPFHLTSRMGGTKESERGTNERNEMGKKRRRDGRKEEDGKADPSYLPGMR